MSKEAIKLALEALKRMKGYGNTFAYRSHEQNPHEQVCEAITALEALAQPDFWEGYVPEPVKPAQQLVDCHATGVCVQSGLRAEQPAQPLPFGVGGGLVAIKTLLSRDPCVHANTAIQMIDAILAEQPAQQERGIKFNEGLHQEREARLSQPAQQEPVSFLDWYDNAHWGNEDFKGGCWRAWDAALKHTSPPAQRTWVGLTEPERLACYDLNPARFASAIERKLKEKNNG